LPISKEKLEKLNLSGEILHDFYYENISIFKEYALDKIKNDCEVEIREKFLIILNFFITRNAVKKPLMTSHYGVSRSVSKTYFFIEIEDHINGFLNETEFDKNFVENILNRIHDLLYDYAKEEIFNKFFVLKKDDFLRSLNFKINDHDRFVNFCYYKQSNIGVDVRYTYNGETIKFTSSRLTEEFDLRKSNTALPANFIHSQDALFADTIFLLENVRPIIIHDSFKVHINHISNVMDRANHYFYSRLEEGYEKILDEKNALQFSKSNKDKVNKEYSLFILV
jgi:hypothetical protein